MFDEYPWLREFYPEKILGFGIGAGGGIGGGGGGAGAVPEGVELTDADVDAGWKLLEERRAAWDDDVDRREGEGDNFQTFIRGGKTAMEKGHGAYDCIIAQGRGFLPKYWLKEFGLGKMYSFSFRLYGEVAACTLAVEVCRRLQYYFDLWVNAEGDVYRYSQADLDSYEETVEWCDFLLGLEDGHPAWDRSREIRRLTPINKPLI